MWSIAICDASKHDCYVLEEMLEDYCREHSVAVEVDLFHDGYFLYEKMKRGARYDLIFLDILMLGAGGKEIGREIRRGLDDEDVQLVYMSGMTGHGNLLMNNRPIGFLEKPMNPRQVFQLADYSRKISVRFQKQFVFQKRKVIYQIPYDEIVYFQSTGRKIQIHGIKEGHEFYGKLSDILGRGVPKQFVQIHQSYIINKDYMVCLNRERIYLKGQEGYLSVSQPYRHLVMRQFEDILES